MEKELFDYIAYKLFVDKNWYDLLLINGIKPSQWPDSAASKLAQRYFDARAGNDHAMARLQACEDLKEVTRVYEDYRDLDDETIIAACKLGCRRYKAMEIATLIMQDPENIEKYMAIWVNEFPVDSLLPFASQIMPVLEENIQKAVKDEAIVTIKNWEILSEAIGGFNRGRLGILIAKTGMGKTTLACNLAVNASITMSVAYFNMEMSTHDFTERLILCSGAFEYQHIKFNPQLMKEQVADVFSKALNRNLSFSNGRSLTPQQIFAMARKHKREFGLDFIIVDYDLKLNIPFERNEQEWKSVQKAIEQFEELAKELDCFILVLAQENEDGDIASSKRAKHHAATAIRFLKDDHGEFLIHVIKNRFGKRDFKLAVSYEPHKSTVKEVGEYIEPIKKSKSFF